MTKNSSSNARNISFIPNNADRFAASDGACPIPTIKIKALFHYANSLDCTAHRGGLLHSSLLGFVAGNAQERCSDGPHRRPPGPVVYRGHSHDRCTHKRCDLHLGARHGHRLAIQLHADGAGFLRGLLCDRLPACAAVLQAQPGLDLRLPGGALWRPHPQDRRLVLLHKQDAGRRSALPGGVRESAGAGV